MTVFEGLREDTVSKIWQAAWKMTVGAAVVAALGAGAWAGITATGDQGRSGTSSVVDAGNWSPNVVAGS